MVNHIAFIMDGNRRYGKKNELSSKEAYSRGMTKFLEFVSFQVKYGIKETSFFALSSDNLKKRSIEEMKVLFQLLKDFSENIEIEDFFVNNKIKITLRGDIKSLKRSVQTKKGLSEKDKNFGKELQKRFDSFTEKMGEPKYFVNLAMNYDGQEEILHSFKEIIKLIDEGEMKKESVTVKTLKKHMYFNDVSPPDVIVRPGNAPRLSGFLLWDSEYSEIYLTKKLWPELDESDFVQILNWFKEIKRNFGQ